jgi:hypothetical protein
VIWPNKKIGVVPVTRPTQIFSERSDSNILKISTPLILVSTTVFKFFVFDHENSQIKILQNTKVSEVSCLFCTCMQVEAALT